VGGGGYVSVCVSRGCACERTCGWIGNVCMVCVHKFKCVCVRVRLCLCLFLCLCVYVYVGVCG